MIRIKFSLNKTSPIFLLSLALIILMINDSHAQIIQIDPDKSQSRTFYISNLGNDKNSGQSESEAWNSLKKISDSNFKPGDIILFKGGDIFKGNLLFNNEEGTDSNPIRISSYGNGRGVLQANSGSCISILNNGGFVIYNLEIKGLYDPDKHYSKNYSEQYSGITIFTYAKKKSKKIVIQNCTIRNFKDNAVSIGGDNKSIFGYTSINAENNTIHNCGDIGIKLWGLKYQKILIKGNRIFDIKGIVPHTHGFSGNGISLSNIYNAEIERNLIYNNGKYAQRSGGGIVTGECRNIFVRYNEIYGIKSQDVDGDAIDFDNGSDSCIAEYNYTHQNDGASVLISGESNGTGSDNNIVRFNISKNDGLRNNLGAIKIYSIVGAENNKIYNNTIITTAFGKNTPACFKIQGPTTNTTVENNIFFTVNFAMLINIDESKQENLILRSNSYFANNAMFIAVWGRKSYKSFDDFVNSTGQEKFDNNNAGIFGNPKLRNPLTQRDTVNNAFKIDTLTAYKLNSFSPLINAGVKVQVNFSPAKTDFFGNPLSIENPPEIGASEF